MTQGSAGFLDTATGIFTADPRSNIPIPGIADPAGLLRGYTWDPVHTRWLPVPPEWVQPDFSSYVYPGTEQPPQIHQVDVASGKDTVVLNGSQLLGHIVADRPDGIYGSPEQTTLMRVDPSGGVAVIDRGHLGFTYVVGDTAIWASAYDFKTHESQGLDRIDPATDASTPWFDKEFDQVIGFDSFGSPVVTVGDIQPGTTTDDVWDIWIAYAAAGPNEVPGIDTATLLWEQPGAARVIYGHTVLSDNTIWFGTSDGLLAFSDPGGLHTVSDFKGYIAGACA